MTTHHGIAPAWAATARTAPGRRQGEFRAILVRKALPWLLIALALLSVPACGGADEFLFSGIRWSVKSGEAGPGPNQWSDDAGSVWVDSQGRLHLKIREVKGRWSCAEIVSETGFGHGDYRFELSTDVEAMDPNAVLGLFVYEDDQHEIDVEMSRWGDGANPVGNYVVQPSDHAGNQRAFPLGLQGEHSTHRFRWLPDRIDFQSIHGHHAAPPTPEHLIQEWSYAGPDVPAAGNERLHLNLWLFRGAAPTDRREVEVIVDRVVVGPPLTLAADAATGDPVLTVSGGVPGDPVVVSGGADQPTDPLVRGRFDARGLFQATWTPDPALSGTTLTLEASSRHASGVTLTSNRAVLVLP